MNFRKDVQNLTEAYKQINEVGPASPPRLYTPGDVATAPAPPKPVPAPPKPAPVGPAKDGSEIKKYLDSLGDPNKWNARDKLIVQKIRDINSGRINSSPSTVVAQMTDDEIISKATQLANKEMIQPGGKGTDILDPTSGMPPGMGENDPPTGSIATTTAPTDSPVKAQPGALDKFADWAKQNPGKAGAAGAGAALVAANLLSKKKKDDDDE